MSEHHKANLAAFVILERNGKILLARRANTGYADGMYGMLSGHVEANEYPTAAAIREAKEEVGVDVAPEDLEFVHASYRIKKADNSGDYADYFFRTRKWSGEPYVAEPDKCDGLLWVSIDDLPENIAPMVKIALEHIKRGSPFSEILDDKPLRSSAIGQ